MNRHVIALHAAQDRRDKAERELDVACRQHVRQPDAVSALKVQAALAQAKHAALVEKRVKYSAPPGAAWFLLCAMAGLALALLLS